MNPNGNKKGHNGTKWDNRGAKRGLNGVKRLKMVFEGIKVGLKGSQGSIKTSFWVNDNFCDRQRQRHIRYAFTVLVEKLKQFFH